MRYFVREVYYFVITLFQKMRNKTLIVQYKAKCTRNSKFEGNNKLSHHSFFSGEMGFASYIGAHSVVIGRIGRYCSIADNVTFLTKTHPVHDFVSTHPCFYSTKKQSGFSYTTEQLFDENPMLENEHYSIEVGNDVYIGYGVMIVGPCRIGNGAVIAAGAVVTGNIPEYAIAGGVPAKVIKNRFSDKEIAYLRKIQWWNMPKNWLRQHVMDFCSIERLMSSDIENKRNEP